MREIQVCAVDKWNPAGLVYRLQFEATGAKLAAWIGSKELTPQERPGSNAAIWACTVASGETELLSSQYQPDLDISEVYPAVSPDLRLVATEWLYLSEEQPEEMVYFTDPTRPDEILPEIAERAYGSGELIFTPDGAELIAVRHLWTDTDDWAPDIVRCAVGILTQPKRSRRSGVLNWKGVRTLPHGERATAAGLSANAQLLAAGCQFGTVHVADLKRKKLLASFAWEGREVRDRAAKRVGFDPEAKWVVMLANGRLFARPLSDGKAWQTKSTLGYAHDFAFHPTGHILCAVFEDGQARYLNPLSGAVVQSFKWSKKPKPLYSVAFAPDGLTCAAGGTDGKVVIWDVDV